MRKRIVYIGSFSFPFGDAVAKRVYGTALALQTGGYEVMIIGEDAAILPGQISDEHKVCGFTLCNIHKPASSKEHYLYRADAKLIGEKLRKWHAEDEIAAVFFCGTKCWLLANAIVNACRKMHIPTIADSMDWLSARTGNVLFDAIKQSDITLELCYVNKKANGVMAISTYLADYYRSKGKKTIIVPPLSPYDHTEFSGELSDAATLVYAGVPCRLDRPLVDPSDAKDRLDIAIALLYRAYTDGMAFQFHIYGMTEEQYLTAFPHQTAIVTELVSAGRIAFLGRVSSDVVKEAVSQADYTILLREKNRTSMAGYPTKISESIALGTPVITTDTSDICDHVCNGTDAFILNIADLDMAYSQLCVALRLEKEQRINMKKNAGSNVSYSPATYADTLQRFIQAL